MTDTQALEDLTQRIERGCDADVLLQLGSPVIVVRTVGPGKDDHTNYDPAVCQRLAKHLCTVLMPKYGLFYNVASGRMGSRILEYRHVR